MTVLAHRKMTPGHIVCWLSRRISLMAVAKQVEVYKEANQTKKAIKVVLHFTDEEYVNLKKIMKELDIKEADDFVVIDARRTNKPSGSKAK